MYGEYMENEIKGTRRDPKAKFIALANKRVNKAIKDLRLIGNLSNRSIYSYDDTQSRKIIKALQKELDLLRAKFSGTNDEDSDLFKL